jgi:uncharacterized LabA/DUF88 family protein
MEKIIVYIDGFNLYFGLKEKNWRRYLWLDLYQLSRDLIKDHQSLVAVKYFTSRISKPPDKSKRQSLFLEALESTKKIEIFYGQYLVNTIECKRCGNIFPKPNEKMTDVNIAVEMLTDAFENKYDTALLISADSDLSGPIKKVKRLFPDKRIILAFPPGRFSFALQKLSHASFIIGKKKFKDNQFPNTITKKDGYKLVRPAKWK